MHRKLSLEDRRQLLQLLFRRWEGWAQPRGYVCQSGCAACCTTKVTMTELEGRLILEYLVAEGRALRLVGEEGARSWRPGLTSNQLAGCCLQGVWPEQEEEQETAHPGAQCRFLGPEDRCTIYPVRPLACRVMASTIDCRQEGCAEVSSVHVTVSAVLSQIVEHLDRGNVWGNMEDILRYLHLQAQIRAEHRRSRLLVCEPAPGWLLPDAERIEVVAFLQTMFADRVEGRPMGEALGLIA